MWYINLVEDSEADTTFPFLIKQPGEEIARGWSESSVYRHEPGWVIKVTYRGKRNTEKQLIENKSDYDFFKNRLGSFVPETYFIRGEDSNGKKVNVIRQREIIGKTLLELTNKEIEENVVARNNLVNLFKKLIQMWDIDGRIPDLVGPKMGGKFHISNFTFGTHPEHTANIKIEDETNDVYLVDTSASIRFQSKKSALPYKKLSEGVVKNLRSFVNKYDQTQ